METADLTIFGKNTIIKSLVLPIITFYFTEHMCTPPPPQMLLNTYIAYSLILYGASEIV